MRRLTVARSFPRDMAAYLDAVGVDSAAVARAAGIDLSGDEGRISGQQMADFWRAARRATADPDLGLRMATASGAGSLDIVGYVMLSSATADEALRRGARLMRLLNDGVDLHLSRAGDSVTATLVLRGDGSDPLWRETRQVTETIMAGLVHQLRLLTARPIAPRAVRFAHDRPAHGDATHRAVFGVAPTFRATDISVELSAVDLATPLRSANASLLAAFTAHAEAALNALGANDGVAGRAATEIIARLKGEAPAVGDVAQALAMSPRSLQRALALEGTSYQQVLSEARRELAARHLAAPGATVAKVAWLLGFSEPSAFYRAQKRWQADGARRTAPPA